MKKFLAITLLAAVAGLGTPAAFADGNSESPGVKLTSSTTTSESDTSTSLTGSSESPGIMMTLIIYMDVLI